MTRTSLLLSLAAAALAPLAAFHAAAHASTVGNARTADPAIEQQMTEAGVRAVEDHWSHAEVVGDTTFLDALLLPTYRSVNVDGTAHPKPAIIAGAKRQGMHPAAAQAAVDSFLKAHPGRTDVTMYGNTAVASFVSLVPASHSAVRGADIFVYADGRWHAIYSAHSNAQ